MLSRILSAIFLSLSFFAVAQTGDNSLADDLLQKAYNFQEESKRDSAIFYFDKASIVYKKDNAWQKYIECLAGENRNYLRTDRIGDVDANATEAIKIIEDGKATEIDPFVIEIHTQFARFFWYAKGNFPEALKYLDKGLALCEAADFNTDKRKIPIFTDYGYTYGYSGDFDNSTIFFKKALDLSKKVYGENADVIADRYTDMVFPLIQKTEWEKAEIALKKAMELNIKNRGPEHMSVLKNYNNLGYIYLEKFDNDQAILYINKALEMIREKFSENHRSIGIGYMNLGASYLNKNEYRESIEYSKKALKNLRISVGEKNPYLALVLLNLGIAYNHNHFPDSAALYYEKALNLNLDLYGAEHQDVARTYGFISDFYLQNKNPNLALEAIHKAMDIADKVLPPKHKLTADNYYYLAEYYAQTGDINKSLTASQQGLIALVPSFEDKDIYSNPVLEDVISTRTIIDVLMRKGKSLYQLYQQNQDLEILKAASKTTIVTDLAIDMLRNEYQTPESKELLLSRTKFFYENAILIAFKLYEQENDLEYIEQAFKYIEKSKSILLLENVKSNSGIARNILPDSIANEEKSLSRSIAFYKEELFEAKNQNDSVKLVSLEDAFFQKKRDYDFLLNLIEARFPEYYSLQHAVFGASLSETQIGLNDQQVIIEYFYGAHNIFGLGISRNDLIPIQIEKDEDIENILNDLINGLGKKQFNPKNAFVAFNKLVNPFLLHCSVKNANQLTFIPDGILHYLPFEIMITSLEKVREKSYLIQDYTINYLHSASLTELYQNSLSKNISYLGFSPGYSMESKTLLASRSARDNQIAGDLQKLPMAEEEVKTSASLWNGEYFFNENATEENFKLLAQNAGIIHIASHAIIDDENPLNSRLVFSPGADTLEDGLLHTYELYNMKLNAQLAVLSACNTGFGQIKSGQGVVSLAKGFFYAGVPNVMMSLWSVPDKSTSEIMTFFNKELKKGVGKADALRNAKLRFLETADENTSDPYYWAAFTMIGDNEPLKTNSNFPYWLIGIVVLVAIGGGKFYRRKQKAQT